jgi:hypothetical protein
MTDQQKSMQQQAQFSQQGAHHDIKAQTVKTELRSDMTTKEADIKTIEKKIITETIPEVHYETKYVEQKVPVAKAVTTEKEVVTAVQETKEIPYTKFVETTEKVPIKKVEQVVETKTIPVTRLEEVTENIPVKKIVAHTEYQKVPVTKLQEKTEYVDVKKVEPVTEYKTVTVTTPVNPQETGKGAVAGQKK